jgi:hypothetical protein
VISRVGVDVGVKVGVGVGVFSFEINGIYTDGDCGVPGWLVASPGSKIATSGVLVGAREGQGVGVLWLVMGFEVACENFAAPAVKLFIRKDAETSNAVANGSNSDLERARFFIMEPAYECIVFVDSGCVDRRRQSNGIGFVSLIYDGKSRNIHCIIGLIG